MLVARVQRHRTAGGQPLGAPSSVVGPALVEDRAGDRALLRAAHVRPGDRRTGVQDAPLAAAEPGDGVARQDQVDQARLRGEVAVVGGAVGLLDARVADQVRERPAECRVRPGGRRPAQVA